MSRADKFYQRLAESGSPVNLIGEDFTIKVIHTQYYQRNDFHTGISERSQTVYSQSVDTVNIAEISAIINK